MTIENLEKIYNNFDTMRDKEIPADISLRAPIFPPPPHIESEGTIYRQNIVGLNPTAQSMLEDMTTPSKTKEEHPTHNLLGLLWHATSPKPTDRPIVHWGKRVARAAPILLLAAGLGAVLRSPEPSSSETVTDQPLAMTLDTPQVGAWFSFDVVNWYYFGLGGHLGRNVLIVELRRWQNGQYGELMVTTVSGGNREGEVLWSHYP